MKTVFIWVIAAVVGGCIDLPPPQGVATGTSIDEDGCDGCPHGLSGELMLVVNGRLASEAALYQTNIPLPDEGTYLGSSIYLYDPDLECDDGTTACRFALLGRVRLDESLGPISVGDGSLKKFSVRELAWSPTSGLWAVTFDTKNDEWGIAQIEVPDWHLTDQELPIKRWNMMPNEDPLADTSDGCYWQEGVSGLGFFGDELLLGVRGLGGVGISNVGMVYTVDTAVTEEGWCVYPDDTTHDPQFYACGVLCRPYARFVEALGIAGDLEVASSGEYPIGFVRAEDPALMPPTEQRLYRIDPPDMGEMLEASALGLAIDQITPGVDLEGLARIDEQLYGIEAWGQVWKLDDDRNAAVRHEDLGAHFDDPSLALRFRGATRVVVPAVPDP